MRNRILSTQGDKTSAGFTLMEMLVVTAIMAILVVSVTPSIKGIVRDSNLTQAGNRVGDLAALAHQNALSHNSMTALIVLTNPPVGTSSAVTVVQLGSDYTWTQITPWTFLPQGISIYDDPTTGVATPLPVFGAAPNLNLQGQSVSSASYSALIFCPDASLYGNTPSSRTVYIQFKTDAAPTAAGNASSVKNYYNLVFSTDTGGAHVVRH